MPIARFQMPDGSIARFEVPAGTSPEEAQRLFEAALVQGTTKSQKVAADAKTYEIELPHGTVIGGIPAQIKAHDVLAIVSGLRPDIVKIKDGLVSSKSSITVTVGDMPATFNATQVVEKPAAHTSVNVDVPKAMTAAGIGSLVGLVVAAAIFWMIAGRLWRKPQVTPHQKGIWWGAWFGTASLFLGLSKLVGTALNSRLTEDDWLQYGLGWSVILPMFYFLVGYVLGWLFRRLRPLVTPTQTSSGTARTSSQQMTIPAQNLSANDEEDLYRQALDEIANDSKKPGVWAMALAKTASGGSPEGSYIALRFEQLKAGYAAK